MIRSLISLYIFVIIADIILSYMPKFRYKPWVVDIRKAADFTCKPIRKLLPAHFPLDFSPMIVILLLNLFAAIF